jgi:hypothetical protein
MTVEKFISTHKLVKYLDQEVVESLIAHQIFDIGNYGWLDENTPDPQFIGHALWQIESPLECDYGAAFGGSTSHRPTEYEEVLAISGADFEGLIQLARMSIGLSLWQQKLAEEALFGDNHYFWLHYVSAMVMLNSASDRLREFFVMGYFQEKIKDYDKKKADDKNRKHFWYQTPFEQAHESRDQSIAEQLGNLVSLSEEIFKYREKRNEIVHEVASKTGKISHDITYKQRERFDEERQSGFVRQEMNFEETSKHFAEAQEAHKGELRAAVDQIISWYKTLVQASSYVFEIENHLRKRRHQTREEKWNTSHIF